jgi:hypothetical protein
MASKTVVRYRNFRRKRTHRKAKMTVPLAVVAGFAPGIGYTFTGYKSGGFKGATDSLTYAYAGYNAGTNKFDMKGLSIGLMPVIAGFIVHMLAGRIGVNRAIGRAGIPFIRI